MELKRGLRRALPGTIPRVVVQRDVAKVALDLCNEVRRAGATGPLSKGNALWFQRWWGR